MDRLVITKAQWTRMRDQVAADAPLESCGLLAGTGEVVSQVIPVPNALQSPSRFRFDPNAQFAAFEQMERDGLEMLAIYHSHPKGPPHPSPTDIADAAYPAATIIWSRQGNDWEARAFWIENGSFVEVSLVISE